MVDIGDAETTIVLAQNVELQVATDSYELMRGVRIEKTHPETRINHGNTRTYGHAAPDVAIRFLLSASSDVFADLKTRSTRNARGVIPSYAWKIRCTSNSNVAKILTLNGKLFETTIIKPDDAAEDPVDIEARIRITDENVTIT